ncbi:porin [Hyphomonas sp.]|uniref:porin n=1 Tax=Hyphomonas sp. TaxID=87 RepID=UPI00391ADCA8
MTRPVLIFLALAGFAPASLAQDIWDDPGGWETEWEADGALIAAPFAGEPVQFAVTAGFSANYVFDNGTGIGFSAGAEFLRDHPARPDFSGLLPPGPPGGGAEPPSAFSRLGRGPAAEGSSPRFGLDHAYIYIEGGYGELRLGSDDGIGVRFFEGGPALFSAAGLVNPDLDPTGRLIARTQNDPTGPASKLSYASPRILGLRAGASYTPEASLESFEDDLEDALPGGIVPELENVVELALNLSRRLPQSGLRLRAALGWSRADVGYALQPGLYGAVETWSAGASVEQGPWRAGASWLSSDNGIAAGSGDYTAWSVSAARSIGRLDLIAEYAEASDDFARLDSRAWQAGLAVTPEEGWRLAAGWRDERLTTGALAPSASPAPRDSRRGIVVEITRSL